MEASIDRATRSIGRESTAPEASSASRSRTSPGSRAVGPPAEATLARGRGGDGDAEAVDGPARVEGDGGGLERGQPVPRASVRIADQDAPVGEERPRRGLEPDLHS